MNAKMKKIENNVVELEITVEAAQFSAAVKKAYAKEAKKFDIPGFRKGKAPMNIIKKYYGEGVFFEEAINICYRDTYFEAVQQNDLKPVDYPEIDVVQIGEGKDLIYTAKVVVAPEVKLGEYKGLEVKKTSYEVKDEEVEAQLKAKAEKNARVETKTEGAVETGDIAVIDFEGFVDDVAFEGGKGTDYSLEIGSGSFIDNFEDQLVGMNVGDTRDVVVNFPADYGKEELNGKPAKFVVTVKEIKVKEIPALDDEFAKEVSEFDTVEELKADTKKKMEETNAAREKREYEDAVIDAVTNNAEIDVPAVMVDREIDGMIGNLEMRLKYQGLDLASYYTYTNSSEEKLRETMKDGAERKIKTDLVLEAIAKLENVEVSEEEIMAKAAEIAQQYPGEDAEKTAKLIVDAQRELIKVDVQNEKVIDLLVESSKAVA